MSIGFNGGLIGKTRVRQPTPSIPGVWDLNEQIVFKRDKKWARNLRQDTYYNQSSLILPFVGEHYSSTLIDYSSSPKTLTSYGDVLLKNNQSKFYDTAAYFNGADNYLRVSSDPEFAFGTGDWTVEGWFRLDTAATNQNLIDMRTTSGSNNSLAIYLGFSILYFYHSGSNYISSAAIVNVDIWYHIAASRNNGSTRLFLNGIQQGSTYSDSTDYVQSPIFIGSNPDGVSLFKGYMQDIRVTKGVGRYTANFSPADSLLI